MVLLYTLRFQFCSAVVAQLPALVCFLLFDLSKSINSVLNSYSTKRLQMRIHNLTVYQCDSFARAFSGLMSDFRGIVDSENMDSPKNIDPSETPYAPPTSSPFRVTSTE